MSEDALAIRVERCIYLRGEKVMLDEDLAALNGVENQGVEQSGEAESGPIPG